jgi:plasmid maintenance system killer protein
VKAFSGFDRRALSRLDQLENATVLTDLASVRGNHLEALKGNRKGHLVFASMINTGFASGGKTGTRPMLKSWTITKK